MIHLLMSEMEFFYVTNRITDFYVSLILELGIYACPKL